MKLRYLMAIVSIFLAGCSPAFRVGECATADVDKERWEGDDNVEKIIEIGKKKYLIEFIGFFSRHRLQYYALIRQYDKLNIKVKCPKELQ